MGIHDREQEKCVPSRRQALCLGAALVAVPTSVVTRAISPQERIARAVKEIEASLAEIYRGAYQRLILELPPVDAFASPLLPDGTFTSGKMAMVSISADSFHERYAAGLVCREDRGPIGRTRA
ncbi:hypothetical protein ACO2RV_11605 [Ancylobacter sp. VNQ12]|uniref:hypothetical protein n=1 Tax=Ancylobacter sp. VNQ12 TaxID=3400920 RepID=UPI003C10B467